MQDPISSCNPAQQEAILHLNGPALVIAGPGSGKTYVITRRLEHMIKEALIPPENILVITFTKASAVEMKDRAHRLLGLAADRIWFGTFHSVFYHILKKTGNDHHQVITSRQKYIFIRDILDSLMLDIKDINETISGIISDISRYKCTLGLTLSHTYDTQEETSFKSIYVSEGDFHEILSRYEACLNSHMLVDFEDMLLKTYLLLKNNIHTRKYWQNRIKYILIDEFQDIDSLQFSTVRFLLGPDKNIFAVGDDDQSIYSFRGARPDIMLNFEKIFPGTHKILLNKNYRSDQEVVKSALKVIGQNLKRFPKKIIPEKTSSGKVEILYFEDRDTEVQFILNKIKTLPTNISVGILSRTNGGCGYISELLRTNNVPFIIHDKPLNIYEHFIAQDIISYIRLSLGDKSRGNFFRIMNKPLRYISRTCLNDPEISFPRLLEHYRNKRKIYKDIVKFQKDIDFIGKLLPFGAVSYILKAIGYEKYLEEYSREYRVDFDGLREIVRELLDRSRNYSSLSVWLEAINNYSQEEHNSNTTSECNINISTLHSSKGLEYDLVFIIDILEGNIPYHKSMEYDALEEERRLFYVGMTRAKSELYLCQLRCLHQKQRSQSQFIKDLLK